MQKIWTKAEPQPVVSYRVLCFDPEHSNPACFGSFGSFDEAKALAECIIENNSYRSMVHVEECREMLVWRSDVNLETQTRPRIKVYRHDKGFSGAIAGIPKRSTDGSAGFDLRSTEKVRIEPGQRVSISTGLSMEIPQGYHIEIRPRSGLAYSDGITVLNSPGTIDSDYRGEISVVLYNAGREPYHVNIGDRIAQAVIMRHEDPEFVEVESIIELSGTPRGGAGFGSTGRI